MMCEDLGICIKEYTIHHKLQASTNRIFAWLPGKYS